MSDPRDDYYRLLGVSETASTHEIRRAFRRLARQHHPDHNPDPDSSARFRKLAHAYAILGDADHRARYDHSTKPGRPHPRSERPSMPARYGTLELSTREARLARASGLRLAADGLSIALPAGTRDRDRILINTLDEKIILTVYVN